MPALSLKTDLQLPPAPTLLQPARPFSNRRRSPLAVLQLQPLPTEPPLAVATSTTWPVRVAQSRRRAAALGARSANATRNCTARARRRARPAARSRADPDPRAPVDLGLSAPAAAVPRGAYRGPSRRWCCRGKVATSTRLAPSPSVSVCHPRPPSRPISSPSSLPPRARLSSPPRALCRSPPCLHHRCLPAGARPPPVHVPPPMRFYNPPWLRHGTAPGSGGAGGGTPGNAPAGSSAAAAAAAGASSRSKQLPAVFSIDLQPGGDGVR
ncbi:LOW QUALITY PROTEIN: hypothetical protein BU14_1933s0001, partial [Porphyra umbilicalis]